MTVYQFMESMIAKRSLRVRLSVGRFPCQQRKQTEENISLLFCLFPVKIRTKPAAMTSKFLSTAGKAGNIEECILGLEAMTETSSVEPDIGSYTHGRLSPDARIVLPQVIWTEITHTKIIRHQRPSTEAGPRRSIDKVECHIAGETT